MSSTRFRVQRTFHRRLKDFRMKLNCCLLLVTVCAVFLVPTDAWGLRRVWRGITRAARKVVCHAGYNLVCPATVGAVTGGVGTAACHVGSFSCKKRTLDEEQDLRALGQVKVPFDPDFDDYDHDNNGLVDFEEFVETIVLALPVNPEELQAPFYDADIDKDGYLSVEEFEAAPFDFGKGGDDDDSSD